ncbi:MAG: hypothetical protein EA405_01455 [Rhodospirillales bacterium]|nr:MAG: hypothetical protein EA405_01455 [Rhodospirillales bacterium]
MNREDCALPNVRLAVASDLHLEFDQAIRARCRGRKPRRSRKAVQAEGHPRTGPNLIGLKGRCNVLLLAGDVDLGPHAIDYAAAVAAWLAVPVVLIAGNHEFYHAAHHETLLALVETGGAALWVHVHTHTSAECAAGGTRVICNPPRLSPVRHQQAPQPRTRHHRVRGRRVRQTACAPPVRGQARMSPRCSAISVRMLARRPLSTSTFLTHSFSIYGAKPIFDEIDRTANQRGPG